MKTFTRIFKSLAGIDDDNYNDIELLEDSEEAQDAMDIDLDVL